MREVTGREPLCFDGGPERVRAIGIVSGGAPTTSPRRSPRGLDAFLTGEPREHVMAEAREAGIHFIAAGHYATETFGVRALGDWLAERFGGRARLRRRPEPGLSGREGAGRMFRPVERIPLRRPRDPVPCVNVAIHTGGI